MKRGIQPPWPWRAGGADGLLSDSPRPIDCTPFCITASGRPWTRHVGCPRHRADPRTQPDAGDQRTRSQTGSLPPARRWRRTFRRSRRADGRGASIERRARRDLWSCIPLSGWHAGGSRARPWPDPERDPFRNQDAAPGPEARTSTKTGDRARACQARGRPLWCGAGSHVGTQGLRDIRVAMMHGVVLGSPAAGIGLCGDRATCDQPPDRFQLPLRRGVMQR